jgi:nucleoside-diphosphate-sugar epimerase
VVFGGTGRTGKIVTEKCLNDPRSSSVTCAVKDMSKARRLFGRDTERLSLVPCDLSQDSSAKMRNIVRGADTVICAAGYTTLSSLDPFGALKVDSIGTRKLIDACIDTKVSRFILLSSLLTNGLVAGQLLEEFYW